MFSHEQILAMEVFKRKFTALKGRAVEVLVAAEKAGTEGEAFAVIQELQRNVARADEALAEFIAAVG